MNSKFVEYSNAATKKLDDALEVKKDEVDNKIVEVDEKINKVNDKIDVVDEKINGINEKADKVEGFVEEVRDIKSQVESIKEQISPGGTTSDETIKEVANARGGERTLGERLDKFDLQLEYKANALDLEVERKRIDAFARLQEGGTTGDAELIDARIDSDGIIHNNVGANLRYNFNKSNNKILIHYYL